VFIKAATIDFTKISLDEVTSSGTHLLLAKSDNGNPTKKVIPSHIPTMAI
jgi:hypothetical protein